MSRSSNTRLTRTLVVLAGAIALVAWVRDLASGPAVLQAAEASLPQGATAVDASLFAPGSCVAFTPTKGARKTSVFLDAGHGGIDPGAIGDTESGKTIYEAAETLPIELDTATILRSDGFRVIVSRTRSSTVMALGSADVSGGELTLLGVHDDVVARDACANRAGASILVGIYLDAGASPDDAGSITAYDADRTFSDTSMRLARTLQADVLAQMNAHGWAIPNDGVLTDATLGSTAGSPSQGGLAAGARSYHHLLLLGPPEPGYFSTPSTMPGALIEPLFVTDPYEASLADTSNGQQVIARGIADGIEQFIAAPRKSR